MLGADVRERPVGVLVVMADLRPGFGRGFGHGGAPGDAVIARRHGRTCSGHPRLAAQRQRMARKGALQIQLSENGPFLADQRYAVKEYIQVLRMPLVDGMLQRRT